jgi:hypothetical protein
MAFSLFLYLQTCQEQITLVLRKTCPDSTSNSFLRQEWPQVSIIYSYEGDNHREWQEGTITFTSRAWMTTKQECITSREEVMMGQENIYL